VLHLKTSRRMKGRLERLGRTGCGCGGDSRGGIRDSDGHDKGGGPTEEGYSESDAEKTRRVVNQTCW
jgi:hypothetical protein